MFADSGNPCCLSREAYDFEGDSHAGRSGLCELCAGTTKEGAETAAGGCLGDLTGVDGVGDMGRVESAVVDKGRGR